MLAGWPWAGYPASLPPAKCICKMETGTGPPLSAASEVKDPVYSLQHPVGTERLSGTFLAVQWLRLQASNAEGAG